MADFPEGFDLAALLAPLPGDAPGGPDLRADYAPDSLYYKLRDARAEARAAERDLDTPNPDRAPPDPAPHWRTIRDLGGQALTRSKDLEIAAWLSEALLRSDGLLGLNAGVRLMAGLVEGFWEGLFPLPDEDGMPTRVAPIAGLNGEGRDGSLMQPLRKIVLFERPDATPLFFYQYEEAAEVAGIGDAARKQQRIEAGAMPFETVENEARRNGARFAVLRRHAEAVVTAWQTLARALDQRAGADGPPTSAIADLLEKIRAVAVRFATAEAAPAETEGDAAAAAPAAAVAGVPQSAVAGSLASREEALRTLTQVAEFFRRTEPMSPLAYTLQEAVRRARLTWPELLEEIVPDAGSRSAILTSLGIRPPPTE